MVLPRAPLVSPSRRQAGGHAQHLAEQRRVVAIRELGAEADAGDVLAQADADQVDLVGVDHVVDAGVRRRRGEQHLRQLVRELAVVQAHRAVEPLGAPARRQTELAALLRLGSGAARGEAEAGREELAVRAVEDEVDRAEVGAALGIARRLPLEHRLRRDRQVVGHLRLHRQLVQRPEQLLGLGAGRGEALLQVERVLRIGDAVQVAAEQHRLAPVHGVAAELGLHRHVAEVDAGRRRRRRAARRCRRGTAAWSCRCTRCRCSSGC